VTERFSPSVDLDEGLFCFARAGYDRGHLELDLLRRATRYLEVDLRMPLPRKLIFLGSDKVGELARRGERWVLWRVGKCISRLSNRARSNIPGVDA
jgi:hypothetical protein